MLGGGSNVVVADAGFPGTVVRIATTGVRRDASGAGSPWPPASRGTPFVARCVEHPLAGIEALSGIPGSVGATPIQNVGAYGQEVSETITAVRAYDRRDGRRQPTSPRRSAPSATGRARSSATPGAGSSCA